MFLLVGETRTTFYHSFGVFRVLEDGRGGGEIDTS